MIFYRFGLVFFFFYLGFFCDFKWGKFGRKIINLFVLNCMFFFFFGIFGFLNDHDVVWAFGLLIVLRLVPKTVGNLTN